MPVKVKKIKKKSSRIIAKISSGSSSDESDTYEPANAEEKVAVFSNNNKVT